MKSQPQDDDATSESSTSPGNQGARGSRGQANSGALPGNPDAAADERAPGESEPDLRKDRAQGGGGIGSESSRSR